ncbi:uncharacterized protein LOC126368368 isoform X1 [Pectinophora gossypiella]|uniref:uncharacterized protein LOC126368368 isoform X1 n=2 Tax=Pectinophora gossypiella TaxID=13191 RepID=UPI00214EFFC2|nr:uncharacterized protein LOC126368368 isoform X1 [Pectinophora gossypiella]
MTRLRNSLTSEFLASASEQMLRTKQEHAQSIFKEYIDLTVQVNDDHDPTPVEEAYFVCMDLLRTTLQSRFGTTAAAAKPSGGSNNVTSKLKLPDIQIPPFDDFIKYLETRALALENSSNNDVIGARKVQATAAVTNNHVAKCYYCGKSDHKIFSCPKFLLASIAERVECIKAKKLCKTCLNSHTGKCRFHFKCTHCKQNHNTLLHDGNETSSSSTEGGVTLLSGLNDNNQVLLPTAKVKILTKNGQELIVKALLDSGSQSSFITTKLANLIGRNLLATNTEVSGIAKTGKKIQSSLQVDIFSCAYPYKVNTNCLVVNKITTNLPQNSFDLSLINIPKNLLLADDTFNKTSEIDILLAADIFFQALLPQLEDQHNELSDPATPRLVHTQFGYLVAGKVPVQSPHELQSTPVSLFCQECKTDLNSNVIQFWKSEAVPEIYPEHPTSEQKYCEEYFNETVQLVDNKFEVSMPLKIPIYDVNNTLGNSLVLAMRRFLNLEKRLHKDEALFKEYQSFIHEYIDLGHASYVDISSYDFNKDAVYFMPHHPVIRENVVSTRLRTVFDGSMKTTNKISLNDIMLNGPVVQNELFDTLLLFRLNKYFFACDIRRMFRNVLIEKSQRSLQNILWRDDPHESIKCLQLNTITYGLKNSSFLATRCLNELAYRFKNEYPLAVPVILNATYVDDILYTHNDLNVIIETKGQLSQLLSKGSFFLHKWSANDSSILQDIPKEQRYSGEINMQKDVKTLGLNFDVNSDTFKFSPPPKQSVKTKREILSFISKFYDPLGLIGPIFVQAKHIMQKLWLSKTDWDSIPPPELNNKWQSLYNDLTNMSSIHIERNTMCKSEHQTFQLIGFSDASNVAYGCAIYVRTIDMQGKVQMSLLCSKSRINPIAPKQLTIPRLELNAALLLAKLASKVYNTISQKQIVNEVHLYTDSQVVLAWLKTDPIKLKSYIANRTKLITECTNNFNWSYIQTDKNPADCLSRGTSPCDLPNHHLWWSGPKEMSDCNYKFKNCTYQLPEDIPEIKCSQNEAVCAAVSLSSNGSSFLDNFIHKYSDINRMKRVLAYVIRFCNNSKPNSAKIKENFVSFAETNNALSLLIKHEQLKYFSKDLNALQNGMQVQASLRGLNPFIDAHGLLRVGGRLQHSGLPYNQMHQIILPRQSLITCMIIENEHNKLLHASQKLILSSLNQRYWIVNALRLIKSVIFKCITE